MPGPRLRLTTSLNPIRRLKHRKVLLDSLLVSLGELERSMEDPEKLNKLRAEEELVAAIKKEVGEIVEASKREQEMAEAG